MASRRSPADGHRSEREQIRHIAVLNAGSGTIKAAWVAVVQGSTVVHKRCSYELALERAPEAVFRVPKLGPLAAYTKQMIDNKLIEHRVHIREQGEDLPEVRTGAGSDPAGSLPGRAQLCRASAARKSKISPASFTPPTNPPENPACRRPATTGSHRRMRFHKNPERWFSIMRTSGPWLTPK